VFIYHCCLPFPLPKYDEKEINVRLQNPFFFPLYLSLLGYLSFHLPKYDLPIILIIRTGTNKRVGSKETNATTQKASKRKKDQRHPPSLITPSHPPLIKDPPKAIKTKELFF
jgi:hypothetical protein